MSIARKLLGENPDLIEFKTYPRGTGVKDVKISITNDHVTIMAKPDYEAAIAYEARREQVLNHVPDCLLEPEVIYKK